MLALYIRVSTEEQALRGYSLNAQEQALKDYAGKKKYKIYRDEGISARKPASKRPALQRLLTDVKSGIIDMICFIKIDRWFRNVKEYYKVQEVLDKHKVPWKAILEDYNTETADGRLKVNIMLSVAENEADRTSERIKFVLEQKKRNGDYIGTVPLGLKRVNGKLMRDEKTAHIIEDAFEHFRKYRNFSKLNRDMHEKYNTHYAPHTWKRRLKSKAYCGFFITESEHEAILEQLPRCDKFNSKRTYVFSGLLLCPCGHRMTASTTITNGTEYPKYVCRYCQIAISEQKLEKKVLAELLDTIKDTIVTIETRNKQVKKTNPQTIKDRLKRLNNAYIMGNLSDIEYTQMSSDLKAELQACTAVVPPKIKEIAEMNIGDIVSGMTKEQRKIFYRQIIEKITLHPDKTITITLVTN